MMPYPHIRSEEERKRCIADMRKRRERNYPTAPVELRCVVRFQLLHVGDKIVLR
jgi:hypothetical protein